MGVKATITFTDGEKLELNCDYIGTDQAGVSYVAIVDEQPISIVNIEYVKFIHVVQDVPNKPKAEIVDLH